MNRENQLLVTDEPVEFEKQPAEVQDIRKITNHFRGNFRVYLKFTKESWKMSTCNLLDLIKIRVVNSHSVSKL